MLKGSSLYLFIQLAVLLVVCLIVFKKKVVLAICSYLCIVSVVFTTAGLTVIDGWKFDDSIYLNYMMMYCFSSNYTMVVA